ncbi:MAG: ABC transporter permease [Armatimonadota bacterium]
MSVSRKAMVAGGTAGPVTGVPARPARGIASFWRRYRRNRAAVAGLAMLILIVCTAILAPALAPRNPLEFGPVSFAPPSRAHPMGTDDLGRDILSGIIYGTRISLMVGFLAVATSTAIGIVVGAASGYFGGRMDAVLMRVTEFFQITPRFFLVLVIVAIVGPSIWNVIFVIGFFSWPVTARLVRGEFLSLKEREYTLAAQAIGQHDLPIIFRHILPNSLTPVIVNSSLEIARAIILESSLSFLGLGDPLVASWGKMLNNAQQFLSRSLWMSCFPGVSIFVTVVALNIVGDGLADALNPRLKTQTG